MSSLRQRINDQNEQERHDLAVAVAKLLRKQPTNNKRHRQPIEDLARVLSKDACVAVRDALACELRECPFIPADVAERIAKDIDNIAIPFIRVNEALSDEFLAELVAECSEAKRIAVAARPAVGESLAFSISRHGGAPSVSRMVENEQAVVSRRVGLEVCDRFNDNPILLKQMADRDDLDVVVVDVLIDRLTRKVGRELVDRYGLAENYAQYISRRTRQRASKNTFSNASDEEVETFLRRLHNLGHLEADTLLHYLDSGETRFFRIALAIRAGIPLENVMILLERGGIAGMKRLLEKCGFAASVVRLLARNYFAVTGSCPTGADAAPTRH